MSSEDPLSKMRCFRVMDWFQNKILLNNFVCGFLLLIIVCVATFNLYHSREDRDKLFMILMLNIGFSSIPAMIVLYSLTNTYVISLHKKANEMFRPLQSEGSKTYDRITRSGRKVAMWLWSLCSVNIFLSIFATSSKELKSIFGFYSLMGRSRYAEGFIIAIILVTVMFPVVLICRHARWTYYIWAQIVLLKAYIRSRLCVRISRYDKGEQELCKKYLREAARFHSDIKSIANDYYNQVRLIAMLLFLPGAGAAALPVLLFFTDMSMSIKIALSSSVIGVILFVYLAVMNIQSTIDESEKLYELLYDCPWYNWDKSNCTTLTIMMSVMRKPLLKTDVFGMIEINYRIYLKIYRVVYAFVTAVLNLK